MKKWISPPIQWLFWLSGVGAISLATWNLYTLWTMTEESHAKQAVNVTLPDLSLLNAPGVATYQAFINRPLLWSSRQVPAPPVVASAPSAPIEIPVDKTLPDGRLVGVIDLGKKSYGIMRTSTAENHYLHVGDKWGSWVVEKVRKDKLTLKLGEEKQDLLLIADFNAPKENPAMLAKKAQDQQQQAQAETLARLKALQAAAAQNLLSSTLEPKAGMPNEAFPPTVEQAPPILSVKDALEARKRLMESRWGSTDSGNKAANQPRSALPNPTNNRLN
ncbi:MAG: hypothetical protein WAQ53_16530 [Thiofilum sp.]|uniref:hypothetical protein n=1 Tax=Thiofilum sp. TaxID=2212733 RepID=UPI0025E6B16D|nr:hypothetical protein [Thiofilum sp.]MBK8452455.1 hypothetical protein [Thiofilum sp.]